MSAMQSWHYGHPEPGKPEHPRAKRRSDDGQGPGHPPKAKSSKSMSIGEADDLPERATAQQSKVTRQVQ